MAEETTTNRNLFWSALIGGAAFLAWKAYQRRQQFRGTLQEQLQECGIDLISLEVGRLESGVPIWHLTVQHPSFGVQALNAELSKDTDPYSDAALHDLMQRIVAWNRNQLVA